MWQINFLKTLNYFLSRYNLNNRKTIARYITHLMCSLVLLLITSLQLVAIYSHTECVFHFSLSFWLHFILTHLQSYRKNVKKISGNFKSLVRVVLVFLKKIVIFLVILRWQHKLVRDYKRGKLLFYFLNNAAKICSYGLKTSENIEIEHVFQSKAFFHLSGNFHKSCLSAFKPNLSFILVIKIFIFWSKFCIYLVKQSTPF